MCTHGLDGDRHWFRWSWRPGDPPRNVWNPLHPTCEKCGATVGDLLRELERVRTERETLLQASKLLVHSLGGDEGEIMSALEGMNAAIGKTRRGA